MNHQDRNRLWHLAGWILFILCAFLFLLCAFRDGDRLLASASLFFLSGCVVFLIPLLFPGADGKKVAGDNGADPQRKTSERS